MEDLKNLGNEKFKNKEYDSALELYNKALELSPDNYILFSNISAVYLKKNDCEKSLEYAIKCTKLSPKWAKGWSRLGSSLLLNNNKEKALVAFKKSRELDKSNSFVNDTILKLEEDTEEESDDESNINYINGNKNNSNDPNNLDPNNFDPNNFNPNNMDPKMLNLFNKMMGNKDILSKMTDPKFQKKVMGNKDNPMNAMNDPDILNMMGMMMKEMKN
jgi:tetratricopeptide (TPR) repeat protein